MRLPFSYFGAIGSGRAFPRNFSTLESGPSKVESMIYGAEGFICCEGCVPSVFAAMSPGGSSEGEGACSAVVAAAAGGGSLLAASVAIEAEEN